MGVVTANSSPIAGEDPPSAIALSCFYAFGYGGRAMYAVRAPFEMSAAGTELVGRIVQIDGCVFKVMAVYRRAIGKVAAGEPLGIEVQSV